MLKSVSVQLVLNRIKDQIRSREVPLSTTKSAADATVIAVTHNVIEMLNTLGFVIAKEVDGAE